MNEWFAVCILAKDPEMRQTKTNKAWCTFSLAVKAGYSKDSEPLFMNAVAWGTNAEYIGKYCHKGDTVAVVAQLQPNNYVDKGNNKHYGIVANIERIRFIKSPKNREENGGTDNQGVFTGFGGIDSDDTLPF